MAIILTFYFGGIVKKIVDGLLYDSDNKGNEFIFERYSNCSMGDFHYYEETLYRTKNGNWFLHGNGNAASKYAKPFGDNQSGPGENIIPLSVGQAFKYLSEYCEIDLLEEYFPGLIKEA